MAERKERESFTVEAFDGLNDVIEDVSLPTGRASWSHGGFYNETHEFERLLGKKLNSSNTSGGSTLHIHQLQFRDRNVVVVHRSSNWISEEDVTELLVDDLPEVLNPLEPVMF